MFVDSTAMTIQIVSCISGSASISMIETGMISITSSAVRLVAMTL